MGTANISGQALWRNQFPPPNPLLQSWFRLELKTTAYSNPSSLADMTRSYGGQFDGKLWRISKYSKRIVESGHQPRTQIPTLAVEQRNEQGLCSGTTATKKRIGVASAW